jgi:hypothetical protein
VPLLGLGSATRRAGVLTMHFWRCVFLRYHSDNPSRRIALHHSSCYYIPSYHILHYYYQLLSITIQNYLIICHLSIHIPWLIQHEDKRAPGARHDVTPPAWTLTPVSKRETRYMQRHTNDPNTRTSSFNIADGNKLANEGKFVYSLPFY